MKIKRKLLLLCIPLFGVLLTAYSPMASFSNAQIQVINLGDLKQNANTELDRRINNYQGTLDNMQSVPVSANGGAGSFSTDGKSSASTVDCVDSSSMSSAASIGPIMVVPLTVTCGSQDKAKQNLQTTVDGLKDMKEKVANTKSTTEMKALAQNIDAQYGLNQAAQAHAGIVQSIASMAGVLDSMKTMYSDVQSRVDALKECLAKDSASPSPSASPSTFPSVLTDPTKQCEGVDTHVTQAFIDQGQATLDSLAIIINSMTTSLRSTVALYNTLADSYDKMLKGLGDKGSLGNLANLSNMTSASDISKLQGTSGNTNGQLTALGGASSQLGINQGMASSASKDMIDFGNGLVGIPLMF